MMVTRDIRMSRMEGSEVRMCVCWFRLSLLSRGQTEAKAVNRMHARRLRGSALVNRKIGAQFPSSASERLYFRNQLNCAA